MESKITLKDLLKSKEFSSIVNESLKEETIVDIVIFGSTARGKENANDLDVLIIYLSKENSDLTYDLRKKLEAKGFAAHIISTTYNKMANSEFLGREGILKEGYSMKNKKNISSMFGYSSFMLFRYSLNGLNDSERMKFYYSLYGRGKATGILQHYGAFKLSDSLIISSIDNSEEIKLFLESKKIPYSEIPILLPARLAGTKFLSK